MCGEPPLHAAHLEGGSRWADRNAALRLRMSPLHFSILLIESALTALWDDLVLDVAPSSQNLCASGSAPVVLPT